MRPNARGPKQLGLRKTFPVFALAAVRFGLRHSNRESNACVQRITRTVNADPSLALYDGETVGGVRLRVARLQHRLVMGVLESRSATPCAGLQSVLLSKFQTGPPRGLLVREPQPLYPGGGRGNLVVDSSSFPFLLARSLVRLRIVRPLSALREVSL